MKKLTSSQNEIIKSIKAEFERINSFQVEEKFSLINVNEIKEEKVNKEKYIAQCKAEQLAFTKMVDGQIRADISKIKNDLEQLGIGVRHFNHKYISRFELFDLKNKHLLRTISYDVKTYKMCKNFDSNEHVSLTYFLFYESLNYNRLGFATIEDLTESEEFKKDIKKLYVNIS